MLLVITSYADILRLIKGNSDMMLVLSKTNMDAIWGTASVHLSTKLLLVSWNFGKPTQLKYFFRRHCCIWKNCSHVDEDQHWFKCSDLESLYKVENWSLGSKYGICHLFWIQPRIGPIGEKLVTRGMSNKIRSRKRDTP